MTRFVIPDGGKRAVAALAFVVLALAALWARRPAKHRPPKEAASAAPPAGSYAAVVAETKVQRKRAELMADAAPGSWSRRAAAASAEMGYAQLTGDYEGYYAADRSLAEAFRVARASIDDEAVGPLLLKAQLSYELHRLRPALESLDVPARQAEFFHDQKLLAQITSLRGAATFALGSYDDGIALMRRSITLDPSASHRQRLAIALAKIGGDDEASRIFETTATEGRAPRSLAWIEHQRAKMALERGDRVAGRRHLENAQQLFPGNWQPEEQLAELDAEEGHVDRAALAYRGLIAKTGDPEFMDALARLIADREPGEAADLKRRSNAIYEERLTRLPEASYGHALEHFLRMSPDAVRAVEIATKNKELRPNGEARTRLAQALVRAGRFPEARTEIDAVLASTWTSAETWATAARIARLAGTGEDEARRLEAKALARNPHALEELDWLQPIT
jgi:tetratricopeptide (TPR) repeat protein